MSCRNLPLVNFAPLAGLLVLASLLAGCKSEKGPITAKSSQFQVADDDDESSSTSGSEQSSDDNSSATGIMTPELPTLSELDQSVPGVEDEEPITPPTRNSNAASRNQNQSRATSRTQPAATDVADDSDAQGETEQNATGEQPPDGTVGSLDAPPVASQESLESLTPPEGPPEVLWQYIVQLKKRQPRGRTERELVADLQRIQAARILAAEMIIANPDAPAELRQQSVDAKLESLQLLIDLGVPDARQHLLAFAQGLRRDRDPRVATMGRILAYTLMVHQVIDGQVGDAQPIVTAGEQLISEEPDLAPKNKEELENYNLVLTQVCSAAVMIMQAGYIDEGKQLVDIIKTKYSGSGDENVEATLSHLVDETHYQELEIQKKLVSFAEGKKEALGPLMEATHEFLTRSNPGLGRLQRALYVAGAVERMQQLNETKEIFQWVGDAFQDEPDPALTAMVKDTLNYADRRLGLLQQPLTIEGQLENGTPLDWSTYQGKVVLVLFWATDNFAYLTQEVPQLEGLLNTYQDQGFEILGVNIDEDKQKLSKFLQLQPLPWPTVLDGTDGEKQMMEKCGVSSVPLTLLIDQSGKVIQLHANSLTLAKQLPTLLGTPDTAPPDGKDEPQPEESGRRELPAADETYFVSCGVIADEQAINDNTAAKTEGTAESDDNPYMAPADLSRAALAEFLLKMEEKPQSIRERPGFDEALLDAAERILKTGEQDNFQLVALEVRLRTLHRRAVFEVEGAEDQLWQFVQSQQAAPPERIARDIQMLTLEHELLQVDELPIEKVPELLERTYEYIQTSNEKLGEKHIRLASSAVHAINRLNVEQREPQFQRFGTAFSKSSHRRLASYGRRIADMKAGPNEELIGQELELAGATALGVEFDWQSYRGKVVLVDFWATWCGPCLSEMVIVKKLFHEYHDRGFEVVGVNLDENVDRLGAFLEKEAPPWNNLVGKSAEDIARRYGIEGIPTLALVDKSGKVVAVAHSSAEFITKIEELLK